MPSLDNSLLDLAHLIGLLNANNGIEWAWFGNPEAYLLGSASDSTIGLAAGTNRNYIGLLLRELLGQPNVLGTDESLLTPFVWVPVNSGDLRVGFAWSKGTPDLELALGADFNPGAGVDLNVLAKLIGINQGAVTSLCKDVMLGGKMPPPAFLSAISIEGDISPLKLKVTVADKASNQLFQTFPPANGAAFAWDCVRMALFIVKAWIQNSLGADPAYNLLNTYLFPLLGDPATAQYPSFPLIGQASLGTVPDFSGWWTKFLPTGNTAQNALALLWRLSAIVTGNTGSRLLKAAGNANAPTGSLFFQLLGASAPAAAMPTDPSQGSAVYTPGSMSPGAWLGLVNNGGGSFTLAIDIQHSTQFTRIPLAALTGGGSTSTISLPQGPDLTSLLADLPTLKSLLPFPIEAAGAGIQIDLFKGTLNAAPLGGSYGFSAIVAANKPVTFQATLGSLPFSFPLTVPSQPQAPLADLLDWIVKFLPANDATGVIAAVEKFTAAELRAAPTPVGDMLTAIALALAPAGKPINIVNSGSFDVSVGLGPDPQGKDAFFHVMPSVKFGPITVDQIPDFPIGIGNLNASLDIGIDGTSPFNGFSLGFDDLRLGGDKGGATGLLASLIPNLKDAPGFSLEVVWSKTSPIKITGGGTIPLQLTLGPLNLSQLQVDASASALKVGIDLSFALSVITVNTYDLGLSFNFQDGSVAPSLNGLGLSFDGAGIKLSGLFVHLKTDYVGGAAVSIEDMFGLSAMGGYTQVGNGQASMFIFASLTAPLGGPPFFFVTGIAGGFGYNRMLPPPTLMGNHPFFKIMSGEIQIPTNPADGMQALAGLDDPKTGFAPKVGDYWIAAGVQFISFGFIHGKVILAVGLGKDFSISILGVASFGIDPVAYFEIDVLVTVDSEKFLMVAGMSPNSYLIHPDIFNLSGDFALGAWHSGPHQGDFLVSIGGFHPYFKAPDYYPVVNRVSVKATVFGFVHLAIECFFACTPQALMAGASVSLSAEFAGIGAGLDVYIDVFIQWDPFFILATMGVDLWFEFLGRHDIGVDLQIHTPPFGGTAHISLFIISFTVSFGDNSTPHPMLAVSEFFTKHLAVPATPTGAADDANVQIFNTATKAGLVRVVFIAGTVAKPTADASKLQEGTDPGEPVQVSPEFSFLVKTKLPLYKNTSEENLTAAQGVLTVKGDVHLPLCLAGDLTSTLTVKINNVTEKHPVGLPNTVANPAVNEEQSELLPSYGYYPLAYFGNAPLVAQASNQSARQAVAGIDTSTPAINLFDGVYFQLNAAPIPATSPTMAGPVEDLSEGAANYPLPLGLPPGVAQPTYRPKAALSFGTATAASQFPPPARASVSTKSPAKLAVTPAVAAAVLASTAASFNRRVKATAAIVTAVAAPPAGVAAMAPPASPVRRTELAGVALAIRPAHLVAAAPTPAVRKLNLIRPVEAVRAVLAQPQVTVASGQAVHVAISAVGVPSGTLTFSGQQTVRAIFSTAFGEPVADIYVAGNQKVALPARSRNVLLIGEGALTGAPASLGSVGVEAATSLYAVGGLQFAGYGCVLWARSNVAGNIQPGQTVTGANLLRAASGWSILFLPAPKAASVLIAIEPAVPKPAAAASQLRWRAVNASLSGLGTVVSPDRAAFVMDVQAASAWTLDTDVSSDWRITGIVMADSAAADVVAILRANAIWSFVDDRFVEPSPPLSTTVTLEIANA